MVRGAGGEGKGRGRRGGGLGGKEYEERETGTLASPSDANTMVKDQLMKTAEASLPKQGQRPPGIRRKPIYSLKRTA